jgi:Flp pilus assembly protein TadD
MRYRRLAIRLLTIASVVCCASLAYFAYGKYRVSSLAAACDEARQAKQWPQLESLSTQWIEWEQDKAQPWLYAAEAASAQGENIRTASYLYYLPNDDPRTPAALLELSHMQFGVLNQPIAAAQTCERILRIQPDNAEAHRRLIFYYAMSRQRARMIEEARRAIGVGCDTPETYLYLIGADWITFTNGLEVNQRWLQSAPDSETFVVAAAFHQVRSSALDESIETPNPDGTSRSEQIMSEMIARFPSNLEVLAFHLDLASFRGNEERVTQLLSQAPPESANDSRFWRFKGWVHETRGEFDEAEAAYKKALELNPFDGQVHHYLAGVYRRSTKPELVEQYQNLAVLGKEVMRDCLQSPNTQSLADELLSKMAAYAEGCGDGLVSERLTERLAKK